ncbi:MAG TPA: hypothetical protein VFS20_23195 [Longimicrobium sp.]|nr:hypothetical protein [Longimicrobium sp.]
MSASSPLKLCVRNPSPYPRAGAVVTGWEPIAARGLAPGSLVVRDENKRELAAQVDLIDPADPARASLAFVLEDSAKPGQEDYGGPASTFVTLEAGSAQQRPDAASVHHAGTGVRLCNSRIEVFISLGPHDGQPYFAGAATSVVVDVRDQPHIMRDRLEILDAHRGLITILGHDPEKRCMQIDRLRIALPLCDDVDLFSRPYELVSSSAGPVHATATIATDKFTVCYVDPLSQRPVVLDECRLYRVFRLFADSACVVEQLYLTAKHDAKRTAPLHFSARYFARMDMGLYPTIIHRPHVPDWLAISCESSPHMGYGFATSAHSDPVLNPHPWFPGSPEEKLRCFSWELGVSSNVTCVHLFAFCSPGELEDRTGQAWYTVVFKPLAATLC